MKARLGFLPVLIIIRCFYFSATRPQGTVLTILYTRTNDIHTTILILERRGGIFVLGRYIRRYDVFLCISGCFYFYFSIVNNWTTLGKRYVLGFSRAPATHVLFVVVGSRAKLLVFIFLSSSPPSILKPRLSLAIGEKISRESFGGFFTALFVFGYGWLYTQAFRLAPRFMTATNYHDYNFVLCLLQCASWVSWVTFRG